MQSGRRTEERSRRLWAGFKYTTIIVLLSSIIWAAETSTQTAPRSRVYRFKNITTSQAKLYLQSMGIGKDIMELSKEAMILTSTSSEELRTASAVLEIVENKGDWSIIPLNASEKLINDFKEDKLSLSVDGLEIGSFVHAPDPKEGPSAIVDIYNGKLYAVAPKGYNAKITEALGKLEIPQPSATKAASVKVVSPLPDAKTVKESTVTQNDTGIVGPPVPAAEKEKTTAVESAKPVDELLSVNDTKEVEEKPQTIKTLTAEKKETGSATASANELLGVTDSKSTEVKPDESKSDKGSFFDDELLKTLDEARETNKTSDLAEAEKRVDEAVLKSIQAQKKAQEAAKAAAEADRIAKELEQAVAEAKAVEEAAKAQLPVKKTETGIDTTAVETKPAPKPDDKTKAGSDELLGASKTTPAPKPEEKTEAKVDELLGTKETKPAPKPLEKETPKPAPVKPAPEPLVKETVAAAKPEPVKPTPKPVVKEAKPAEPKPAEKPEEEKTETPPVEDEIDIAAIARMLMAGEKVELPAPAETEKPESKLPSPPKLIKQTPRPAPVEKETDPKVESKPAVAETTKPDTSLVTADAPLNHTEKMALQMKDMPGGTDPEKELVLTVDIPEKIQISALVDLVGKMLGLNYIYDPAKLNGEVILKVHNGKIKVKDVYALLESVLRFKGLIMTRRDNLVIIDTTASALKNDPSLIKEGDQIKPGDIVVTSIFKLEHISTQSAEGALKGLQLGSTYQQIPESQTLIVTDYAFRMERIRDVLTMIDVQAEENTLETQMLQYTVASKLAPKVQSLAGYMGTVQISISSVTSSSPTTTTARPTTSSSAASAAARAKAAADAARRSATSSGQPAEDMVHLDTDDRTNRIFIIGKKDKIDIVKSLITQLDVPEQTLRFIKEYEIQYIDTQNVVDTLYELGVIDSPVTSSSSTTSPYGTTSRTTTSRTSPTTSRTTVPRPTTSTSSRTASADETGPDDPLISIRESTNSLLINATEEQHKEIQLVVSHIDIEQTDSRTIKQYEIQHVDAGEIVTVMEELGVIQPKMNTSSYGSSSRYGTSSSNRYGTATNPTTRTPTTTTAAPAPAPTNLTGEAVTAEDLTSEQPQIAILGSSNALLVSATPRQHASIALIISHVDREIDQSTTPFVVYALENQDPEELAGVLDQLVNAQIQSQQAQLAGSTTGSTGTRTTSTVGSKIETKPKAIGGVRSDDFDITIVPDKATYSLIVYANKKNQQWIAKLIETLDDYRPQVLLDVTLVEVTKQDDFNYDLNIVSSFPDLKNTSGLTGAADVLGATSSSILNALRNTTDRTSFQDFQSASGDFKGFYGDRKIQALFTAMQTKKYGRVLAKPKLLVDDNQEGTIETKTTTYITRTTSNTQIPDNGAPVTTQNDVFEPYDASISLAIKPHISQGDNLRLEITLSRSDFVNFDPQSLKPPNQAVSDVTTVVTVPNSSTIILGGMDKVNQSKGGDKVPILGDIPLLGGLFRSTSNTSQQNKLYIFIKANILRPGDETEGESDLVKISRQNRSDFEETESEMQKYDDWPGIKPQPMDPLRVLEEDINR